MFRVKIAAVLALLVVAGGAALEHAPVAPAYAAAKQAAQPVKPGARPGAETCRWAQDNECDEPVIGTGACAANTDYSDCRYIREGERDACQYARDGECDEPGFGTGVCPMGSDRTDCGDVRALRFRDDSCATAFNDVCEEPGEGTGACARRTDRADCAGRERPPAISDHFFGRDDRVLMDRTAFPWRVVGEVTFRDDNACTATLIARDVLITAAHCIAGDSGVNSRGRFVTAVGLAGGPYEANVIAHRISPRFNSRRFSEGRELDGHDWALLRIDRPLGDQLGFIPVRARFAGLSDSEARTIDLFQAGYSWDTGEHLSGNIGCHAVQLFSDNTFAHECDTTRGDSGSPFLVRNGEGYELIGVDSRFRSNPGGSFIYIAVSAAAFEAQAAEFIAQPAPAPRARKTER